MHPTTLEDRVQVLADNILQGGYSKAQLVSIVTSFVNAFANPEAAVKLASIQLTVEDCQALLTMTTTDVASKMGAKDPTVRDLDSISKLLSKLSEGSGVAVSYLGVLDKASGQLVKYTPPKLPEGGIYAYGCGLPPTKPSEGLPT